MKVTSFRAWGRLRPLFNNNSLVAGTKLLHKSYQSGQVFCSFRRKVMTPNGSELYMLDLSQNQHAIWGMGPLARDNLPGKHFFRAASGEPIDIRFRVCKSCFCLQKQLSTVHCMKRIPSFLWSIFSQIWTEHENYVNLRSSLHNGR